MWVFTKYGFFSAVCARQGDGKHGQPVDSDRIMVRARVREHLEALADHFPDLLSGEILQSAKTDYAFRVFLPKAAWAQLVSELAEEIHYDNFKSAVADRQGRDGADYEYALHDVWAVMHRLQTSGSQRPERSATAIDALLPFLDRLTAEGFSPGEWQTEPGVFPRFDLGETAAAFLKALYKHGWVKPGFNWPRWQEGESYIESPEKIASADVETIRRLFTTHARADRFCEGHLAEMLRNGHIAALLHRLRQLRETV